MLKIALLAASLAVARAYVWPSPYDFLEDGYSVATGLNAGGMMAEISTCGAAPFGGRLSGRQAAAEWIRTAYHDMATHDVNTGLGGLDGSIGFETNRPQNIGSAMNTSMVFFAGFQGRTSSVSDVMALSVILATKQCGGPSVPFRAGRVDATSGGPETVPEPHQSLESHIESFAKQGFNAEEMIGLVACGHTLGGTHEIDFPQTVNGAVTGDNPEGVMHFDKTFDAFDNHIATEWIDGTTSNPLAAGFNATTNSDARIFASDGNKTMQGFASDPASFQKVCGNLFERMLNTVPRSVQLTDVIEPLPVKPFGLTLALVESGALALSGWIRIFSNAPEAANANADNMPVTLIWKDRNGASNASYSTTPTAASQTSTSIFGSFVHFWQVDAEIQPEFGHSSFVVDWAFDAQEGLTRADNGGGGFPLQDVVLFQPIGSCNTLTTTTVIVNIRNDLGAVTSPTVEYTLNVAIQGTIATRPNTTFVALSPTSSPASFSPLYDTYIGTFPRGPQIPLGRTTFDVVATVGGKEYKQLNNLAVQGACGF
ncbi:Peroxidase [Mycena kentingensis (nom. inval.)]|nr:Peroxidase [Mycena kentingensis (nom. inval.)]